MKITIRNTSRITALWKTEKMKRFRRLKAGASVCLDIPTAPVRLSVRPNGNTQYRDMTSIFTVQSDYRFEAFGSMTLTLSYEKAQADLDAAYHTFRRMALKGLAGPYEVTYRVVPPDKVKSGITNFLSESLMNLLLDAGLPLLFGLIAWFKTGHIGKSLLTAAAALVVLTAVTLGAEKLFDKLSDKRRKRKGLAGRNEPIGLARCLDPDYIDCMFKKAAL